MCLVSIVVPIYNMADKIESSLKSILNQTYKSLEIILVDDGSVDNTYEKCKELQRLDARIIIVHTKNQGSGPARNEGIKRATGQYIYFPDADDYIEPNAIETLVKCIQDNNCDLVVFGFNSIGVSGKLISQKVYSNSVFAGESVRKDYAKFLNQFDNYTIQGAPWNKFFDLRVINKFKIKFPSLRRHQDEAFIARYMDKTERVCFISDILYTYFVNDLTLQWDKYPIDYIDAVDGLFNDRKENILKWNCDDLYTHDLVLRDYICGLIKAFELSFSPKHNYNFVKRITWMRNMLQNRNLNNISIPKSLGIYQKVVFSLMKKRIVILIYAILKFKVLMERTGSIRRIKRV